jgi:hypothetical protein
MNRWDDYLAATVQLDDVRREAAATVAAQQAASSVAHAELASVRQRIGFQRLRLAEIATTVSRSVPSMEPLDSERDAAVAVLTATTTDVTPDIMAALQGARATLDAADATLSAATDVPQRRGVLGARPPGIRNAIVYGWFALLALCAIIEINIIAGGSLQAAVVIAASAIVVPAGAWVLGWLSLRLLYGRPAASDSFGGSVPGASGPRRATGGVVGALLCAVPAVVGLILSVV